MRKILSYSRPSFSLENVKGSSNYKTIKSGRSLDIAYLLGAMTRRDCHVASLLTITTFLFSFNVYAPCTPTPDCASIGYTETSCETDYLACPFDSTKLKCIPCDSSFRYDCSGDNITGGTGSACGGKYVTCECVAGGVFSNGSCTCETSCTVGKIYYSDGTCSSCVDNTKIAVGIVVKDNEIIMGYESSYMSWSPEYQNVSGLESISKSKNALEDMNGRENTSLIVDYWGADTAGVAAVYCYDYFPADFEVSKNQWYLPAAGEVYDYLYGDGIHYNLINATMQNLGKKLQSTIVWSSSMKNGGSAWNLKITDGTMFYGYGGMTGRYSVVCCLSI